MRLRMGLPPQKKEDGTQWRGVAHMAMGAPGWKL